MTAKLWTRLFCMVVLVAIVVPVSVLVTPQTVLAATVFLETMGTGGTNGDSIATHEINNRFDNDAFTMSGTGDMRNTSTSSGYTGASGTWNVMLNATEEYFQIADIPTTGYTNLVLSFGVRKSTTAEDGSGLIVEVSSDGSTWTALTVPSLPTGTGTAIWHYRTASGTIPATTNLRIRFRSTNTVEWRIDDVSLEDDLTSDLSPTVSATIPSNDATGVAVDADISVTFSEAVNRVVP